jgi:hypothetical protein
MAYLRDIAQGLRSAAGVLNPDVQRQTFKEDSDMEQMQRQFAQQAERDRRVFEMQQSTPEAQMKREQLLNERNFRAEAVEAAGDVGKLASAAMKYGKPELAINIYNQQESRAARAQQAVQAHEARMAEIERRKEEGLARISDQRDRAAFEQQYKLERLALDRQRISFEREMRKETLEVRRLQLLTGAAEKGGGAGMSAESAGKVAMADQAIMDIRGTREIIFDKDGKLNKDIVAAMNVPGTAGLPFNENARGAYSRMYNAVEAKLRIETGAAATEREIKSILNRFLPSISDSDKVAKDKIDRLEEFMNTTIDQTKGVKKELLKSRTGATSAGGTPKISNDAEYAALPSGAEFIAPDGSKRRKP